MREYLKGIYQEKDLPGVFLGVVAGDDACLLIDTPLRLEESRDWLTQVEPLGAPQFLVLLDSHPDRALGARHFDLPCIAHLATAKAMAAWSDTYKGTSDPIGAEADSVKRVTGLRRGVPDVIFHGEMMVELTGRPVRLLERPGPTPGSIWVEVPDKETVYVGDAVTVNEPPYLGLADIEAWLTNLDRLREAPFDGYKVLSSRDGLVDRDQINDMARFLRKVPVRVDRMDERADPVGAADTFAAELIEDFKVTKARYAVALLRLRAGLLHLYRRGRPKGG
jgi:glyoxylase-like metal-dependent hydrolase (beta-lactamase superfamily II)